ncbi:MAG: SPASM domain-containing protein [Candidatus Aminicenantes bacterium]|nr:SPASM domain-containing protein [Candidatus Aminicenantes bacterium]
MDDYGKIFIEKNLCPAPFMNLIINRYGECYSCVKNYMKKRIIVGNILEKPLKEIWNSREIKKLRRTVYKNNYQEICKPNCPSLIALKKKKIGMGKYADFDIFRQVRENKTHLDSPYRCVIIATNPCCNLACIMCRTKRQIKLNELEKKINRATLDEIRENISNLRLLRFSGDGEVFVNELAIEFFQMLEHKDTSYLTLGITTNGQLLDKSKWEMLKRLKVARLELGVSIDAVTKQTYEKIRRHGNWERLNKHMDMLAKERSKGNLHHLAINFVVMRCNIEEIEQFIRLGEKWNCDAINFSRVFKKKIAAAQDFFNPPDRYYLDKLSDILQNPIFDKSHVWAGQILPFRDAKRDRGE